MPFSDNNCAILLTIKDVPFFEVPTKATIFLSFVSKLDKFISISTFLIGSIFCSCSLATLFVYSFLSKLSNLGTVSSSSDILLKSSNPGSIFCCSSSNSDNELPFSLLSSRPGNILSFSSISSDSGSLSSNPGNVVSSRSSRPGKISSSFSSSISNKLTISFGSESSRISLLSISDCSFLGLPLFFFI